MTDFIKSLNTFITGGAEFGDLPAILEHKAGAVSRLAYWLTSAAIRRSGRRLERLGAYAAQPVQSTTG
jgi:hypothetical protein